MNYFIYAIHHFTPHRSYELNQLTSPPICGFIAQLVEHHIGIVEVTGSKPVEALIFFQASSFHLLKLEIYCDDHSLISLKLVLSLSGQTQIYNSCNAFIAKAN